MVDDNPEAGHLISQLLRRRDYEVASITDHATTVGTLSVQDEPIAGVVAAFSLTGTTAGLRLVDALRNHPLESVNQVRVLLISDQPRQQIFCLQAGADGILLRPFTGDDLCDATDAMVQRSEPDRIPYRRSMVELLKVDLARDGEHGEPVGAGAGAFS